MAKPIESAAEAIARAEALTGLGAVSENPEAVLAPLADDATPYLGERNAGKSVWRVTYPEASLAFASARRGLLDPYWRTFEVVLEAATGRLFFVASTYHGERDPQMRPMPACGPATAQLAAEQEVYAGYPAQDPGITFLAALERILTAGRGSPFAAKEMHAAYVMHSRRAGKPKPAWAVTLRGLPPVAAHGPAGDEVPVWQRNHMRNIVDAATGAVLFATNSPQPE
jgi:hypothetical protein